MKSNVFLLILFSLITRSISAPVKKRSATKKPFILDFSVERVSGKQAGSSRYNRQSSLLNLELQNEYSLYLAELEVGTPGQKIRVDIDTGSSDFWVPAINTPSDCGTFDANASSTFKKVFDGFDTAYSDGTVAKGIWAEDYVTLGGTQIPDVRFGYATSQTAKQSVLGVGFIHNEEPALAFRNSYTYENFPVKMKNNNILDRICYSLYLNNANAKGGSILFGGIDHAKYEGDKLTKLDIVTINNFGLPTQNPVGFFVNMNGLKLGNTSFTNGVYPALLDSGSTLIYAPRSVAEKVGAAYGKYDSKVGGYTTLCDSQGNDLEFTFGEATIKVPFKDVLYNLNGKKEGESDQCLVGVLPSLVNTYTLGDSFLRNAYVFYDLEAIEIKIAQVKYSNDTDIELISPFTQ